jgi:hypothetical protein
MISTTVTSLSYAGQNVLTVTDSSGFLAGQTVRIGRGTADDETGVIASVGTGTITLVNNLAHTHVSTTPSDNLKLFATPIQTYSNNTTNWTVANPAGNITVPYTIRGAQRYSFAIGTATPGWMGYGRIYRDSALGSNRYVIGGQQSENSTDFSERFQDETTELLVGDEIIIQSRISTGGPNSYAGCLKVYFDWVSGQTVETIDLTKSITDNTSVSKSISKSLACDRNLLDYVFSGETVAPSLPQQNILDNVGISEDVIPSLPSKSLTDNIGISESVLKNLIVSKSIVDTIGIIFSTNVFRRLDDSNYIEDLTQTFISNEFKNRILSLSITDYSVTPTNYITHNTVILSNDEHRIYFNPPVEIDTTHFTYTILKEYADYISPSSTSLGQFGYIDKYVNKTEVTSKVGTGLENDQFYYYTAFVHNVDKNVAETSFALFDAPNSTQQVALSIKNEDFNTRLLNYWPNVFKQLDTTNDLNDLMEVFGFGLNELYSSVKTFDLTNSDKMLHSILPSKGLQTGISEVSYSMGVDHMRRIVSDLLPTWKLKGSKQGIVDFIRILTTWDVGTRDASVIIDTIPEIAGADTSALGLWKDTPASLHNNLRIFGSIQSYPPSTAAVGTVPSTYTYDTGTGTIQYVIGEDLSEVAVNDTFVDGSGASFYVRTINTSSSNITLDTGLTIDTTSRGYIYRSSGRFYSTTTSNGITIPGYFLFREYDVEIKNIALYTGEMTKLDINSDGTSKLTDSLANFGAVDSLVGNYILPKQDKVNEVFVISANTATTITMLGIVRNIVAEGNYAILSPLNAIRFSKLVHFMKEFEPSFARVAFQFT